MTGIIYDDFESLSKLNKDVHDATMIILRILSKER